MRARFTRALTLALVLTWVPELGATVAAGPYRQTFIRPEVGAGALIPGGDERTTVAAAFRLAHGWSLSRTWQLGGMSSTQWTPTDDRAITSLYAHGVLHERAMAGRGYRVDLGAGLAQPLGENPEAHLGPGWLFGFGLPVWSSTPYHYHRLEAGGREWISRLVVALSYEGSYTERLDHALSLTLSYDLERIRFEY